MPSVLSSIDTHVVHGERGALPQTRQLQRERGNDCLRPRPGVLRLETLVRDWHGLCLPTVCLRWLELLRLRYLVQTAVFSRLRPLHFASKIIQSHLVKSYLW